MNVKHDRTKVLQMGIELFCEKGYTALGVDEIIKKTGMTKGAFYNAFGSKETFLMEALEFYSVRNVERILDKLDPKVGIKAIERIERFYLEMLEVQVKINHKGCMINNIQSELGGVNDLVTSSTNAHFNAFLSAIEPTVVEAQQEGDLTEEVSAKEITELLHSSFYGILIRLKGQNDPASSKNLFKILLTSFKK